MMSLPLLAGGAEDAQGARRGQETRREDEPGPQSQESARRGQSPVATEEQCLAALSSLPGLVALGVLSPAKANSMKGTYQAILSHHRAKRGSEERTGVADDAMLEALVRHPELANLLEPLLSRDQIAAILARAK